MTKLVENIYRSVNIGLVNELKIAADKMGIDIWEVIRAAATKPFGFTPFYPGPGLGGHCIPIDPFYLTWKAREYGVHTRFIELAGEINRSMPEYVVHKVIDALNEDCKSLKGSKILLLGLAYKPNVDDDRESPSYILIQKLEAHGATVEYNDPFVPVIPTTREHAQYAGRKSVEITDSYDCLLLATHHSAYADFDFSQFSSPLVDSRNCVTKPPRQILQGLKSCLPPVGPIAAAVGPDYPAAETPLPKPMRRALFFLFTRAPHCHRHSAGKWDHHGGWSLPQVVPTAGGPYLR